MGAYKQIIVTIKDLPGGNVSVVSEPSFEEMARRINSGETSTSAEAYALVAINAIRKKSKEEGPIPILIPKVRH